MMGRFLRQLRGRGKREQMATQMMARHHEDAEKTQKEISAQVAAVEDLVRALKKDVSKWQQS